MVYDRYTVTIAMEFITNYKPTCNSGGTILYQWLLNHCQIIEQSIHDIIRSIIPGVKSRIFPLYPNKMRHTPLS
jgi:hypothetical protein